MDRRSFLRISLIASLGYVLMGCSGRDGNPPTAPAAKPDPAVPESLDGLLAFRKGDSHYDEHRGGFNLRFQKHPAVIVLCRSTEEVATAVRYALQEGLPVSVKSGGHCFEGFSSNDGGMVVDVSLMNTVDWLPGSEGAVRIGPGLTLTGMYDQLLPRGRIVPAGSCGSVAISGLTLGGGYGLFSRQMGLACDSLTAVTLVDGSGKICTTDDDPELLWACRGGGNGNFGVVTSLSFKTHAAPKGLFSHRFKAYKLDSARAARLLRGWCELATDLPRTSFSAFVLNGTTLTILVTDTENTDAELARVLAELGKLTDKAIPGDRQELAPALRRYYGIDHPILFKNASAGFYSGYADISDVFPSVAQTVAENRGMIFQVNTLGGAVADPQLERASAFPHRSFPFLAELQTYYDKPEQGPGLLEGFRKVQDLLRDGGVTRHYRNYPDLDFENWAEAYYGLNYKRLQRVKAASDPRGLFSYAQGVRA